MTPRLYAQSQPSYPHPQPQPQPPPQPQSQQACLRPFFSPPSPPVDPNQMTSLPSISSLLQFGKEPTASHPPRQTPMQSTNLFDPTESRASVSNSEMPPPSTRANLPPTPPPRPESPTSGRHSPASYSHHSTQPHGPYYLGLSLNNMEPHQQRQPTVTLPGKRYSLPNQHAPSPTSLPPTPSLLRVAPPSPALALTTRHIANIPTRLRLRHTPSPTPMPRNVLFRRTFPRQPGFPSRKSDLRPVLQLRKLQIRGSTITTSPRQTNKTSRSRRTATSVRLARRPSLDRAVCASTATATPGKSRSSVLMQDAVKRSACGAT